MYRLNNKKWSSLGYGEWLMIDLGEVKMTGAANISFFSGDNRQSIFMLEVSTAGTQWMTVYDGNSSGTTKLLEEFQFTDVKPARYVRYVGYGNSSNLL